MKMFHRKPKALKTDALEAWCYVQPSGGIEVLVRSDKSQRGTDAIMIPPKLVRAAIRNSKRWALRALSPVPQ